MTGPAPLSLAVHGILSVQHCQHRLSCDMLIASPRHLIE
jgi:hypothetical protein